MNTIFSRGNVLLVNFVLAGAFMAFLTACTDYLETPVHPDVKMSVHTVKRMKNNLRKNDQVALEWTIDADLSSYWTWNTKTIFAFVQAEYESDFNKLNQVSLHDVIITKGKDTKLKRKMKQEYDFIDQGSHLRGMPLNMTLTWCIMPKVGVLKEYSHTVPVGRLPLEYVSSETPMEPISS